MRTTIVIEGGRVSVQVDDQEPVTVQEPLEVVLPRTAPEHHESKPALVTTPKKAKVDTDYAPKPTAKTIKKTCVRCRVEFEAPARHGFRKYCDDCQKELDVKPTASVEKLCSDCGNKFTASGTGCHKRKRCDDCKAAVATNSVPAMRSATPAPPAPKTAPKEASQLEFMPGHEKTPEEIQQWRAMVPSGMPEAPVPRSEGKIDTEGYADPWNCKQCRHYGALCEFHQGMEDGGHKPPKIWPQQ